MVPSQLNTFLPMRPGGFGHILYLISDMNILLGLEKAHACDGEVGGPSSAAAKGVLGLEYLGLLISGYQERLL